MIETHSGPNPSGETVTWQAGDLASKLEKTPQFVGDVNSTTDYYVGGFVRGE